MKRRHFILSALAGTAAVAAAPTVLDNFDEPVIRYFSDETLMSSWGELAVIGGYADYASFSSVAVGESWDEMIDDCAKELGVRAGQSIATLNAYAFDVQPERSFLQRLFGV